MEREGDRGEEKGTEERSEVERGGKEVREEREGKEEGGERGRERGEIGQSFHLPVHPAMIIIESTLSQPLDPLQSTPHILHSPHTSLILKLKNSAFIKLISLPPPPPPPFLYGWTQGPYQHQATTHHSDDDRSCLRI